MHQEELVREIALELARQGANVAVNYSGSEAKANEVVDEIKALGREAFAIKCDVSNSESSVRNGKRNN